MKRLTGQWVRKAEADWRVVERLGQNDPLVRDSVCFHCQQASKKYLKALLQELGLTVPRSHDLDFLLGELLPHHPTLRGLRRGMKALSEFAVETRYPGENTNQRQVAMAWRWAERVRIEVRSMLALPLPSAP